MNKNDLFFKAIAGKKPGGMPSRFAEGGEAPPPPDAAGPEDGDVSPDEKLAAYEILEIVGGIGSGPDGKSKAVRLAKALKSFFLLVDAQPHTEGGEEPAEEAGPSFSK